MEHLEGFTHPTTAKCDKITILTKHSHLGRKRDHGVCRSHPIFSLNVIII